MSDTDQLIEELGGDWYPWDLPRAASLITRAADALVRLQQERDEWKRNHEHEREVSRALARELDPLAERAGLGTRPPLAQQMDQVEALTRRAEKAEARVAELEERLLIHMTEDEYMREREALQARVAELEAENDVLRPLATRSYAGPAWMFKEYVKDALAGKDIPR